MKAKDLIFDQRNANKHSEYGMRRLEDSIQKRGLGRSILISADNEIIAGNGVAETALGIGIEKVKVVETDGTEIIAVKRTDIKSGTKEFYEMALSDNIIATENIVMDAEVTNAICEEYEIEDEIVVPYIEKSNSLRNIIGNNYDADKDVYNGNVFYLELSTTQIAALNKIAKENDLRSEKDAIIHIIEKYV